MATKHRPGSMRPLQVLVPPAEIDAGAVQGLFMGSRYWVWLEPSGEWRWRVEWGGDVSRAYINSNPKTSDAQLTQRDARAAAYQAIRSAANYHPPQDSRDVED